VAANDDEDEMDVDEECRHDEQSFRHRAQRMLESVGLASDNVDRYGGSSVDVDSKLRGKVDKFLNRLLGLKLSEQQQLFDFFSSTFDAVVMQKRAEGTFDEGVVNLKAQHLTEVSCEHLHTDKLSGATTTITTLKLDRGVSWDAALKRMEEQKEITASIQERQEQRDEEEAEAMARAEGVGVDALIALGRRRRQRDDDDDETLGGFIVSDGEEEEEEEHVSDSDDDSGSGGSSKAKGKKGKKGKNDTKGKKGKKGSSKKGSSKKGDSSVIKYTARQRKPFGAYNGFWTSTRKYHNGEKKMILLALELPQSAGSRYNSARKFKTIRPHVGDQPVKEFFELSNNNEFVQLSSNLSRLRKVGVK
jgi:hypothetical protein